MRSKRYYIEKRKQRFINKHQELYDECMREAMAKVSGDPTKEADILYVSRVTAEHIVGLYLFRYGDFALIIWKKNLSLYLRAKKTKPTHKDKEVSRILHRLFR